MLEAWLPSSTLNGAHHDQFVVDFVNRISTSLKEYGNSKGYSFPSNLARDQYYLDLAWGGLTETAAFLGLPPSIRNRILDTLATEQYGVDRNGNPTIKKGGPSGC